MFNIMFLNVRSCKHRHALKINIKKIKVLKNVILYLLAFNLSYFFCFRILNATKPEQLEMLYLYCKF